MRQLTLKNISTLPILLFLLINLPLLISPYSQSHQLSRILTQTQTSSPEESPRKSNPPSTNFDQITFTLVIIVVSVILLVLVLIALIVFFYRCVRGGQFNRARTRTYNIEDGIEMVQMWPGLDFVLYRKYIRLNVLDICAICLDVFTVNNTKNIQIVDLQQQPQQNTKKQQNMVQNSIQKPPTLTHTHTIIQNSNNSTIKLTICGHLFHQQCLNIWLMRQNVCPMCRLQFTTNIMNISGIKIKVNLIEWMNNIKHLHNDNISECHNLLQNQLSYVDKNNKNNNNETIQCMNDAYNMNKDTQHSHQHQHQQIYEQITFNKQINKKDKQILLLYLLIKKLYNKLGTQQLTSIQFQSNCQNTNLFFQSQNHPQLFNIHIQDYSQPFPCVSFNYRRQRRKQKKMGNMNLFIINNQLPVLQQIQH